MHKIKIIFIWATMMTACSSDPCDDVPCVNGDCNEGTCECESGWTGEFCNQIDFDHVGKFEVRSIIFDDCDSEENEGLLLPNLSNEFCQESPSETFCLSISLDVNSDNTFELIYTERTIIDGVSNNEVDIIQGTFEITDSQFDFCSPVLPSCAIMKINAGRSGYDWTLPNRIDGINCQITYRFFRI